MKKRLGGIHYPREKVRKLLLMTKISIVLMLFCLQIQANVFSQQTRLSMKLGNVSIKQLFLEIEKATNLSFVYDTKIVDRLGNVDVNFTNEEIGRILDYCFTGKGVEYSFVDDHVIIRKGDPVSLEQQVEKRKITGVVKDRQGTPLPGVTILIKGTQTGVATDIDGQFSLTTPIAGNLTLTVSFIGMKTKEVTVTGNQPLDITMDEDKQVMDEVVVTGYQKIDRKLFTGSASKVDVKETLLQGVPDLTRSLQGQVAGVQVNNVSGTFGAAPVVTIRGNSSINGTNKPLWVVDGVILEDLVQASAQELTSGNLATLLTSGVAGLNPDDIESMEILKDVSATSLYGAQAMNGVIVITTKSGRKGKVNVNYSGSVSLRPKPSYSDFDIMSSDDEMSVYKELEGKGWLSMTTVAKSENFGAMGKMFDEIYKGNINWGPNGRLNEDFLSKYANANTDWFDVLFTNSVTHQHSFSFSGGGEKSAFYASLSYFKDNGQTVADKVARYTATLRGKFDITKNFNVGVKLAANLRDQTVPGTNNRSFNAITGEFSRDFDINPYSFALNTSRSMRAYDDNGDYEYFRRNYAPFNILYELGHNQVDIRVQDLSAQVDLEWEVIKGLTLRGTGSMRRATTLREHKIHETANQAEAYRAAGTQDIMNANKFLFRDPLKPLENPYSILPEGGFYNTIHDNLSHYYFRGVFDYSPAIGDDHSLNLFGGFEVNYANRDNRAQDGWGIVYDRGGVVVSSPDLSRYLSTNGMSYFSFDEMRDRRASFFVNGAYSYMGKYIMNVGFRRDGSNQLGKSKSARYLPSWNISGAWNMQTEPFMQGVSHIFSQLKPKISYGYNGIMGPSTSASLSVYARQTVRPQDNETYNSIEALANDDLTWEKMYELNAGLEFGLFSNRVMVDFAYYNRKSVDLIDWVVTSGIGGFARKFGNIGDMKSHGFEMSLNTVNIKQSDFEWSMNLNVNFHKSEITRLNDYSRISDAVANTGTALLGYPQRGLFSVKFAGLDNQGIPTFYDAQNRVVYDMDLQGRNDITKILKYEGPIEPKGYGGWTNRFQYRGVEFSFGLVYKYGNVIRLDDAFAPYYNDFSAFTKELKNRWMFSGDEKKTNIPAILDKRTFDKIESYQTYEMYNKSTERVAKGDFIRLKDITLRYTFPDRILKHSFMNTASVSFQANNLWLIWSDKALNGIDPEFYSSGGVSLPVSRLYTFSVNIGF